MDSTARSAGRRLGHVREELDVGMAVAWIAGGCAFGSLIAALLAFLAVAQARAWHADRQVYFRPPTLSPAQVRWANEKRLSDDPEATLIIPADHPDYIRPVDWQALRARHRT